MIAIPLELMGSDSLSTCLANVIRNKESRVSGGVWHRCEAPLTRMFSGCLLPMLTKYGTLR